MENTNVSSDSILYAMAALAIKLKKCLPWHRPNLQQNIAKLYVVYKLLLQQEQTRTSGRSVWVREIFTEEQRLLQGVSTNLIKEMRRSDTKKFANFLRMSPDTFDKLLAIVEPLIRKQNVVRNSIEPKLRLEITLRYLASGDSMVSLSYYFRVGKQTVSSFIAETCEAIWISLKNDVFIQPNIENWKDIARGFEQNWHSKNCIGAVDGKHVVVQVIMQFNISAI